MKTRVGEQRSLEGSRRPDASRGPPVSYVDNTQLCVICGDRASRKHYGVHR